MLRQLFFICFNVGMVLLYFFVPSFLIRQNHASILFVHQDRDQIRCDRLLFLNDRPEGARNAVITDHVIIDLPIVIAKQFLPLTPVLGLVQYGTAVFQHDLFYKSAFYSIASVQLLHRRK